MSSVVNLGIVSILILIVAVRDYGVAGHVPRSRHAMVVAAHRLAAEAGVNVLRKGGNAVDAAVAVGFALAVVYPEAGNIGGGGFMLVRLNNGTTSVIDFREKSPRSAFRTMYLDSMGNVTDRTVNGHLAAAVPGTVAGFLKALDSYGTKSREELIQPAIDLADTGFLVDARLEGLLEEYRADLAMYPSTMKVFSRQGALVREGDTLRQPDLARTLRRIREDGNDGFYGGETARLIVDEVQRGGGIITEDDLEDYEPTIRNPIRGTYRGYEVIGPPLPSSGGICLIQLLNMVESSDLRSMGFHSSRSIHLMTESMKRVFADRAEFLGDPDFVEAPVEKLISKEYARQRASEIDTAAATRSQFVTNGKHYLDESENTTHFSIVDEQGNAVAVTYTINDLFGCKVVVDGAGFFLNDEMDDFSAKPGVPNMYGLLGSTANAIEPGKRPLSSMTPVILLKNGRPMIVLGARGGSKIITALFQTIVNVIDFQMNIDQAVNLPRFSHQWYPEELSFEKYGLPIDVLDNLSRLGHKSVEVSGSLGQIEAILVDTESGWLFGGADRREGGVVIGY